ncbi:unnamed protein product [Gongylonema pulchrum]|uniref:EGF-like domain-containing protein n=1 Tax=Gongylonema pulchrum TaxID=637853 RepID=A0A183CWH7_9BILA|nr:unnamed protein product [Gongylonema pulchrum]
MVPRAFALYGSGMPPQYPAFPTDFLSRGPFSNNLGMAALGSNTLNTHFLGANILNDKDKFEASGCTYDSGRARCIDNLGACKGRCKDFGSGLTHDCKCIPDNLLTILGLAVARK